MSSHWVWSEKATVRSKPKNNLIIFIRSANFRALKDEMLFLHKQKLVTVLPLLSPLFFHIKMPLALAFSVFLALSCWPSLFLPFPFLYSADFSQCHFPLGKRGRVSVCWRIRVSLHGWTAGGSLEKKGNLHNFSASFHENYMLLPSSFRRHPLDHMLSSCLMCSRCLVPLLSTP